MLLWHVINHHTHQLELSHKIANKISRTLGVMNRLNLYLPLPFAPSIRNYKLGLWMGSHIKTAKRAFRIMTNSWYNAHTEPVFKLLHLLKVKVIFEIKCLKLWYKYVNNKLPNDFRIMFTCSHELNEIETRNHDRLRLYPTRTSDARNVLRQHIPALLN